MDPENIKRHIQQINTESGGDFFELVIQSDLLSLTEPIFFEQLKVMVQDIKINQTKGCMMEAGVWKGATAIFLKSLMNSMDLDKNLWLLDGFGKELDDKRYKHAKDLLAIEKFKKLSDQIKFPTLQDVKKNFNRFDLWDEKIIAVEGDIFETFDLFNENTISLLRIDLDYFESTYFMLEKFYPKISIGGYIIIDDYGVDDFNCREAVDEFRRSNNITDPLIRVGNFVAYWKKTKD